MWFEKFQKCLLDSGGKNQNFFSFRLKMSKNGQDAGGHTSVKAYWLFCFPQSHWMFRYIFYVMVFKKNIWSERFIIEVIYEFNVIRI